jgi:hypothetical protein
MNPANRVVLTQTDFHVLAEGLDVVLIRTCSTGVNVSFCGTMTSGWAHLHRLKAFETWGQSPHWLNWR